MIICFQLLDLPVGNVLRYQSVDVNSATTVESARGGRVNIDNRRKLILPQRRIHNTIGQEPSIDGRENPLIRRYAFAQASQVPASEVD